MIHQNEKYMKGFSRDQHKADFLKKNFLDANCIVGYAARLNYLKMHLMHKVLIVSLLVHKKSSQLFLWPLGSYLRLYYPDAHFPRNAKLRIAPVQTMTTMTGWLFGSAVLGSWCIKLKQIKKF